LERQLTEQATAFDAERAQFAAKIAELTAKIADQDQRLAAAAAVATTPDVIPVRPSKIDGETPSVFKELKRKAA
jgi:hypothetical protein